jgi:signal transduction histidine kinase/CheY-like chemotaxis protein
VLDKHRNLYLEGLPVVASLLVAIVSAVAAGVLSRSSAATFVVIGMYFLLRKRTKYALLLLPVATAWAVSSMPFAFAVTGAFLGTAIFLWTEDDYVAYVAAACQTVAVVAVNVKDGADWSQLILFLLAIATLLLFKRNRDLVAQSLLSERENSHKLKVAGYGHEFRTPLTNIQNGLQQLSASALATRQRQWVHEIGLNIEAMNILTNNAVDWMLGPRIRSEGQCVFLPEELRQIIDRHRLTATAKGLYLGSFIYGEALSVSVDTQILRTAIPNFVGNALKFTTCGGVSVLARTFNEDSILKLEVVVVDTGPGISPDVESKVFKESVTTTPDGAFRTSGIGMLIAAREVITGGGTISCSNRPAGGASFKIVIPVEAAPNYEFRPRGLRRAVLVTENKGFLAAAQLELERSGVTVVREVPRNFRLSAAKTDGHSVLILDADTFAGSPIEFANSVTYEKHPRSILLVGNGILWSPMLAETLAEAAFAGTCSTTDPASVLAAIHAVRVMTASHQHMTDLATTQDAPIRVLLAEDEPSMRRIWHSTLVVAGMQVRAVETGSEAMELISARNDFDIALLDFNLPGHNADAIVARRRKIEASDDLPRLPIVIMTAERANTVDHLFPIGAVSNILSKPLGDGEMLRAVGDALAADKRFVVTEGEESQSVPLDAKMIKRDGLLNLLADTTAGVKAADPRRVAHSTHKMRAIVARSDVALHDLLEEPTPDALPYEADMWLASITSACHEHIRLHFSEAAA